MKSFVEWLDKADSEDLAMINLSTYEREIRKLADLYKGAVKALETPCTATMWTICSCCRAAGEIESLFDKEIR